MLIKLIIMLCTYSYVEEHDNSTVNEHTQEKAIAGDTVDMTTTFIPAKGDNQHFSLITCFFLCVLTVLPSVYPHSHGRVS